MSTSFTRPRGDAVRVVHWDEEGGPPPLALYADLRVGDLVHDEGGYRSLGSYVVTAEGALSPIGKDGNGNGMIWAGVTSHLVDPVGFYATELEGAVCDIELDPRLHARALRGVELEADKDLLEGKIWWSLGSYRAGTA